MGERDVFPHVGRQTQVRLPGVQHPVYPVITGTFGGVDFLHSVMGEFDDKATQSEIEQLEGTMQNGSRADTSLLKELLSKIPSGLLGDDDKASKADDLQQNSNTARLNATHFTRIQPEQITQQMMEIQKQIYPIMEWHDDIMRTITETIEQIPVLPELIEQLEDQINVFVFSLLAPFMIPVIQQLKLELNTGSSEIIKSSEDKQLIVFHDDHCSDPTHSMLSKDHFSDVLNEPAGRVASQVVKWVVPQLMEAWDNTNVDPDRTINRIINGVFHHPALRNSGEDGAADGRKLMFGVVESWWRQANQDDLRQQLSRSGVENGENHKPGQHDTGHGCGKPLGMAKMTGGDGAGGMLGELISALGGGAGAASIGQGYGRPDFHSKASGEISQFAEQAVGGGALGGIVGALAGGIGGSLLGGAFGSKETESFTQQQQTPGGGVTQSYTEVGRRQNQHGQTEYGQAQYQETSFPGGGSRTEYKQYNQEGSGSQGAYGYEQRTETKPTYGGGFEHTERTTFKSNEESYGGHREDEERHKVKKRDSDDEKEGKYGRKKKDSDDENEGGYGRKKKDSDDDDDDEYGRKKEKKHKKKKQHSGGEESEDSDEEKNRRRQNRHSGGGGGGYQQGGEREQYGGRNQQEEYNDRGGYGNQRANEYQEPPRREEYGGGGFGGNEYGGRQQEQGGFGGGGNEYGGGRQREQGGFGGGDEYGGGRGGGGFGGEPERMPGGFGGDEYGGQQQQGGYGGGGGYGQEEQRGGYGGGNDGNEWQEERRDEGRGW